MVYVVYYVGQYQYMHIDSDSDTDITTSISSSLLGNMVKIYVVCSLYVNKYCIMQPLCKKYCK